MQASMPVWPRVNSRTYCVRWPRASPRLGLSSIKAEWIILETTNYNYGSCLLSKPVRLLFWGNTFHLHSWSFGLRARVSAFLIIASRLEHKTAYDYIFAFQPSLAFFQAIWNHNWLETLTRTSVKELILSVLLVNLSLYSEQTMTRITVVNKNDPERLFSNLRLRRQFYMVSITLLPRLNPLHSSY